MRNSPFWWVLIAFMVLLDFYVFQAVKSLSAPAGTRTRLVIHYGYWIISGAALILLLLLPYLHLENQGKLVRSTFFAVIAGLFFAKLLAGVIFLVDDIRRAVQWVAAKTFFSNTEGEGMQQGEKISRSNFLTWAGFAVGGGLFGSLLYGFGNKYRYQLKKVAISFANLPAAFKGLKLVHISDIHAGSFTDKKAVEKGVDMILAQKPDLILFTGDLVNNLAEEMIDYVDVFGRLKATYGVYSVLGNHDYGDYVRWEDKDSTHLQRDVKSGAPQMSPLQAANLEQLKALQAAMGWKVLVDEHMPIEKDGEKIAILGVQNISAKARFHSYGNLQKAYDGAREFPFKILMSHDPSHWDAEVRKSYTDIDLMLSGHTHGMQFGVEIPGFKWSPVQYIYRQWAGLYETGTQKLYVNPGFGFIGYPGRVGILPEITVIELS